MKIYFKLLFVTVIALFVSGCASTSGPAHFSSVDSTGGYVSGSAGSYSPGYGYYTPTYRMSERYSKQERGIVNVRPMSHAQFPVGQSKLPPTPKRSYMYVDTGRYQKEVVKDGYVGYTERYNYATGSIETIADKVEYKSTYVEKRKPQQIPYHTLPDRGSGTGYQTTTIMVPLKPLLTGPISVGR